MEAHALNSYRSCKKCGISSSDMSLFVKDKGSKYGRRQLCISCKVKENEANPQQKEWKTDHQTKKRYGVDSETYNRLMASSSQCQICSSPDNLCYDHCHTTMKFRGILCRKCNSAIGLLGDSIDGLEKALNYLKRTPTNGQRKQTYRAH